MRSVPVVILLILLWSGANAQFGAGKVAIARMEKGKWKDAEQTLRKSLRKDSTDVELNYIFSWFFSSSANPRNNIDSAFRYVNLAIRGYSQCAGKEKARLKKFPIDSSILLRRQSVIDSVAFDRAKALNTEHGYDDFLGKFGSSPNRSGAMELRDEVAFLNAMKMNTAGAFENYLRDHPTSLRAREAQQRLDKLVYSTRTADRKLASYKLFFDEFPGSPHRADAEWNIFSISTASGRRTAFDEFIRAYPSGKYVRTAEALRYHLMKEEEHAAGNLPDSLRQIQRNENGFWIPVMKNGKFSFMNENGAETIKAEFDSIREEYRCGNIRADFLVVAGGIINRQGNWIIRQKVGNVTDIGAGFLKVVAGDCKYGVHKSGLITTAACYDDVKIVGRNFIGIREKDKWGLLTFSCLLLQETLYDSIFSLDTLIVFAGHGKKYLATIDQIAGKADGIAFKPSLVFDDIRRLSHGNYLVRNGALQGVLNSDLRFILPMARYEINISPVGFTLGAEGKTRVVGLTGVSDSTQFDEVKFYGKWASLRLRGETRLYNIAAKKFEALKIDSLWFRNNIAFVRTRDSVKAFVRSSVVVGWQKDGKVSFIKSVDSSGYFVVSDKIKKTVFSVITGKRLFSHPADAVDYIGHDCFVITKQNRKGIVFRDGRLLLPVQYMAIVPVSEGWVSLLKDKKFGIYQLTTRKLIQAVYDRNVIPFSSKLLVAYKNGAFGFIDSNAKPQSDFEFEEVRRWNDTSAIIKKNYLWMIYGIRSKKILLRDIRDYHYVNESPVESNAIIRKANAYGVISNKRGEIVPSAFSEIINVGSPENPVYFTDKNVEEAGIHVLIYYDRDGKILRKQAIEESDYERILCEEN